MINKRTKIVATISDRNCDPGLIKQLIKAGMNVVRLNTAHQTYEETLKVINNVRSVADHVSILLDTKGPEIRTTKAEEEIPVDSGDKICIKGDPNGISSRGMLYVSYPSFVDDVPMGSVILIDDGSIELKVIEKKEDCLLCEVLNQGLIEGKKSVNIPSVHVKLPALSQKDIDYIHFAIENELDFIAHSFVRRKEDVFAIQEILDKHKSPIKIIAKIENQEGVDNIDEILENTYGIMIARGDLAVEIPQERIPGVQKALIQKAIEHRKVVITATQMLHSMINSPRPTRAEISDVANAIYDGTDAVMLSGETAYGKYPVKAVETMANIAIQAEQSLTGIRETSYKVLNTQVTAYLTYSAMKAAVDLNAQAIIADTSSGRTIRGLSAYRGPKMIFAQCYDKRVMRELSLVYGAFTNYMEPNHLSNEQFIFEALNNLKSRDRVQNEDLVVVIAGNFGPTHGASFIEISSVEKLLIKAEAAMKKESTLHNS
ncbi:MAG: pyruvate kinase [Cyclobacteriaceae bacterium]